VAGDAMHLVGWGDARNLSDPARAAKLGFPSVTTSLRRAVTTSLRSAATASLRAAVTTLLVGGACASHAQQDALHLRTLAANCAQCHGTNGRAAPGSALPSIAGMPRDYLLTQLHAFKAGTRASTIMQQLARGYSDTQLEQLATFFAAQKP